MASVFTGLLLFICFLPVLSQNSDTTFIEDVDGRFTIGMKDHKLMYGFPNPLSTSHFVVKINKDFASSRSGFEGADYLKGRMKIYTKNGAIYSETEYDYKRVKIIQKLIPVDPALNPVDNPKNIQYYRIEYQLINQSNTAKDIGLTMFFDTQVAENDACWAEPFPASFYNSMKDSTQRKKETIFGKISFGLFGGKFGMEQLYEKSQVPSIILAYRNKWKKTDDITGVFLTDQGAATRPDQLLIGRWPFYYNTLWDFNPPKSKKIKYTDSAVLMRWMQSKTESGQSKSFICYYGFYHPKGLDMKFQENYNTIFKVEPDVIMQGDEAQVIWETQNKLNAQINISQVGQNQQNKGNMKIAPDSSTVYKLEMVYQKKIIGTWTAPITVLSKPSNKLSADDGRFTLGSDSINLTFGYPFPYSTSHFVLYCDNKIASNYSPIVDSMNYLKGDLQIIANKGSSQTITNYKWNDLLISQRLIPNDSNMQNLNDTLFGNYYKIEYNIINNTGKDAQIGLGLLLDLDLIERKGGFAKMDNQAVGLNTTFKNPLPDVLSFYQKETDKKAIGSIMFNSARAVPPDVLYIGQWQQFNALKWDLSEFKPDYTHDYAVWMRWNPKKVSAAQPLKIITYLGSDILKHLNVNHNRKENTKSGEVYFAVAKSNLTDKSLQTLKKLFENETPAYIVIEGFTDPSGKPETNFKLSQDRVQSVKDYLVKELKQNESLILSKSHGEYYSTDKKAKEQDRKVTITIYRKI